MASKSSTNGAARDPDDGTAAAVGSADPGQSVDRIDSAYDPHACEFCGEELDDPGLAFLEHLDESPSCRWLWSWYRGHIIAEAGES